MQYQTMKVDAGTSISTACREAIKLATKIGEWVSFEFNGIKMIASSSDNPSVLARLWQDKMDAEAEAYSKSPAGLKAAAKSQAESCIAQRNVTACLKNLPKVLSEGGLNELMEWFKSFTEYADHIDARFDKKAVIDQLTAAGYVANEGAGQKPAWFSNRSRIGRYIVGQAIACMESGMPPHPMALRFIDEYFAFRA